MRITERFFKPESMENNFEAWAVIELFGRSQIAGQCSEQSIAGATMLRVDVPETKANPKFTRFLGGTAIYAINPVTEEMARLVAERLCIKPIDSWDIREFEKKYLALKADSKGVELPDQNSDEN